MQPKKVDRTSGTAPINNNKYVAKTKEGQTLVREDQKERILPPAGTYIPGQPLNSGQSKTLVIDEFKNQVDLNRDGYEDLMSHGDAIVTFTGDPKAEKIQIGHSIGNQLETIRNRREAGEDIGVVNISNGYQLGFEEMAQVVGKPVNAENLRKMAPEYINGLKANSKSYDEKETSIKADIADIDRQLKTSDDTFLKMKKKALTLKQEQITKERDYIKIYDEVDNLKALNTPVVVAAGNLSGFESNGYVNAIALNPNVICVGATDSPTTGNGHQESDYTYKNSLVDVNMQGTYAPSEIPKAIKSNLAPTNKSSKDPLKGSMTGTSNSAPLASRYTKIMHEKGMSVDEINKTFSQAETIAEQQNKKTSLVLDQLLNL